MTAISFSIFIRDGDVKMNAVSGNGSGQRSYFLVISEIHYDISPGHSHTGWIKGTDCCDDAAGNDSVFPAVFFNSFS